MGVYKFEVIHLGKAGIEDWDTSNTHNLIVENKDSFKDYDSTADAGNQLFQKRETITVTSNNPNDDNLYEDSTALHYLGNTGYGGTVTWDGGSGAIDSFIIANVTFTFHDETTYTGDVRFMQTLTGDTFLLSYDGDSQNYTEKAIGHIHVNAVKNDQDWLIQHEYNDRAFPCFARGTKIETPRGEIQVEAIRAGDLVNTCDHGALPIRWVGSRLLSKKFLSRHPKHRPIRIKAGALGANTPKTDLIVSPQHRILVRSAIAQRIFGTDEVLVAAKQLLDIDGIEIAGDIEEVTYVHVMFDRHEVVIANGAMTESLFTGPEALKAVGAGAREEIFAIFPELRSRDIPMQPARFVAKGRKCRQLANCHAKNRRNLFADDRYDDVKNVKRRETGSAV